METELILVTGASEILKKLASVIASEIRLTWTIKRELVELQNTLEMILAVIGDAEKMQVTHRSIRAWLRRLKDVVFNAEDLLDEFSYEYLRRRDMNGLIYKVRDLLSSSNPILFHFKMAHKIKYINLKLDEVANDMRRFRLNLTSSTSGEQQNQESSPAPVIADLIVVGRDKDKKIIVDRLLTIDTSSSSSSYHNQNEKILVLPIVGMGGLGKTTLAQLVYKDESVVKHFEQRIWVCVSDGFNINTLLGDILESITGIKCTDVSNMEVLVHRIHEKLIGKKFLLVLDDLWNENEERWERFKNLLVVGAQGSKILVTTRKHGIADKIRGTIHHLSSLSDSECWSIIQQRAFAPGQECDSRMVQIGMEMAKNCRGLPLVASIVGGLMYLNKDESFWRSMIQEIETFHKSESEIMFLLQFSCNHCLPSHLKHCFSYCSIFPMGQKIYRESLIRLWMAEGLIQPYYDEKEKSMEDIGNEYFNSLVRSAFFQDVEKDDLGNIEMFKMHYLVYDLAKSLVRNHGFSDLKASEMENISAVRHLRLVFDEEMSTIFPKALHNSEKLRKVVHIQASNYKKIKSVFRNTQLRVLEVRNLWIEKLPAFAKLKHLRYLDLSHCQCLLPSQSISSLYNLQTLILRGCSFIWELPKDIGSLRNLRHLDLSYTRIEFLPDSCTTLHNLRSLILTSCQLNRLPSDIGGLENLRHLDVSATKIKEFPNSVTRLHSLRTLKFDFCRSLKALPRDFKELKHLRCLDFSGTKIKVLPECITSCFYHLETLKLGQCKLPEDIKNLTNLRHFIYDGERTESPRGMGQLTLLQTLQQFVVRRDAEREGCGIGDLAGLNLLHGKLMICNLENVSGGIDAQGANLKLKTNIHYLDLRWTSRSFHDENSVPDGGVLEALQPHDGLKILKIKNFMGLKLPAWVGDSLTSCLPHLVELVLQDCSKCEQLPALGQLPYLRVLYIHGMNSVKSLGDELYGGESRNGENATAIAFPSLIELTLHSMENLEAWVAPPPPPASFRFLEKMTISSCHKLLVIPTPFPSLKELKLQSCDALMSLPDMRCLNSLWKLTVRDCKGLKLSPDDLKSLSSFLWLDIDTPISPF